jgi:1,4-alpha-glucan branching enzyme
LQQHNVVKPINFFCHAPNAEAVSIVGDFNKWHPNANPMTQQLDGSWQASVDMKHGHHRYAFLVDGTMTLDPKALGVTRDDLDNRVSLLSVS